MHKESSLHNVLKFQYAGTDGKTEVRTGPYIYDGVTPSGEIVEVQTGSFAPLREKVKALVPHNKICIIHPIIVHKYIELFDKDGVLVSRRKSPRQGTAWDVFKALVYAPELATLSQVTIELGMVDIVEKRIQDGLGSWRRKGVSIADKTLAGQYPSVILAKKEDYCRFVLFADTEQFTVKELAAKAGIRKGLAAKALFVLMSIGIVQRVGKAGRAWVYTRSSGVSGLTP